MKKLLLFSVKDSFRSKNSLLILFCIFFSISLPIIIFTISDSLMTGAQKKAFDVYGYFDNVLYNAKRKIDTLNLDDNVLNSYFGMEAVDKVGTITVFEKVQETSESVAVLGYLDDIAVQLSSLKILEGRLPRGEGEIAFCNSLNYQKSTMGKIGELVTCNGKDYVLVGIISDFSARWEKPKSEISIPNAIIGFSDAKEQKIASQHLLIDNKQPFSEELYISNEDLKANVLRTQEDNSYRYQVPIAVIVIVAACSFLLNIYTLMFFAETQTKKLAILRCCNMTKTRSVLFVLYKMLILLCISMPFGIFISCGVSWITIEAFNSALGTANKMNVLSKHIVLSIIICIATTLLSSLFILKKIATVSPLNLFSSNETNNSISMIRKTRRFHNLIKLSIIDLKKYLKKSIVVTLMIAFSLSLINFYLIYMKIFVSQYNEFETMMPLNFDYEFTTNQTISQTSYVDEAGNVIQIHSTPNSETVCYIPDYSRVIADEIIREMENNPKIEKIGKYYEENHMYLLDAPNEEENPFLINFSNDSKLNEAIANMFSIVSNTRSVQFFGYSEKELIELEKYVSEGSINLEKIRTGEEIILMAPMYEYTVGEGYTQQDFIEIDQYSGKSNQFKDTYYSVGQTICISQFIPKDKNLFGYVTNEQLENELIQKDITVKIGAVIPQRVAWFDNINAPQMAYSIIGLNDSFQELEIMPTHSRIRIYLKDAISYKEFTPEIQYYAGRMEAFDFRNNSAEMDAFQEFKIILNAMYSVLICIIVFVIIVIILLEERIRLQSKKKYYALLRINGLSLLRVGKLILLQSMFFGICGMLIAIPIVYAMIKIVFGGMHDLFNFISPIEVMCSFLVMYFTVLLTSISSIYYIKKRGIIRLMLN